MRIGFATWSDPEDVKSFSGTHRFMLKALREYGYEITVLGPLASRSLVLGKVANRVLKSTTGYFLDPTHTWLAARDFANDLERKTQGQRLDIIFAPASSTAFVCAHLNLPIVYYTDATFRLIQNSYAHYAKMFSFSLRWADQIEQAALVKAKISLFPSHWAAESALQDYGIASDRIGIVPMGANLEQEPSKKDALIARAHDVCQLLFVGVWWERKGGKTALAVLRELRARGVPAKLTVCGCLPPETDPDMEVIPFLDKKSKQDAARLAELFMRSHFFILPTQADAFPMVLSEASAYGLPCLSTQVGGVGEIVLDGVTGVLFRSDAAAAHYANVIEDLWNAEGRRTAMGAAARQRYEDTLNWPAWAAGVAQYF